mgnify:CR=1 FL=1
MNITRPALPSPRWLNSNVVNWYACVYSAHRCNHGQRTVRKAEHPTCERVPADYIECSASSLIACVTAHPVARWIRQFKLPDGVELVDDAIMNVRAPAQLPRPHS